MYRCSTRERRANKYYRKFRLVNEGNNEQANSISGPAPVAAAVHGRHDICAHFTPAAQRHLSSVPCTPFSIELIMAPADSGACAGCVCVVYNLIPGTYYVCLVPIYVVV